MIEMFLSLLRRRTAADSTTSPRRLGTRAAAGGSLSLVTLTPAETSQHHTLLASWLASWLAAERGSGGDKPSSPSFLTDAAERKRFFIMTRCLKKLMKANKRWQRASIITSSGAAFH